MSERPAGSDAPENVPPTAGEQMQWWFSGPWMSRLVVVLLLSAAMLFLLAMADRWPPEQRTIANEILGGVLAFAFGWVIAPLVRASTWPVMRANQVHGCLGYLACQAWIFGIAILFIVFVAKTEFRMGPILGLAGGIAARSTLPLVQALLSGRLAIPGPMLAACAGLGIAEAAALAVWFAGKAHGATAWAAIALIVPPVLGVFLKSRGWMVLALIPAVASVLAVGWWPAPLPEMPVLRHPAAASLWQEVFLIGLIGAMLGMVGAWIGRTAEDLGVGGTG
jgi:hypothetical protein